MIHKFTMLLVAVAVLTVAGSAMGAVEYTTEASFLGAIAPGYYLEDFGSVLPNPSDLPTSLDFGPVNGYSFTATAPDGLYGIPGVPGYEPALSTNTASDPITITFTGAPVTAVGGTFMATDIDGNLWDADVTVLLSDGTTQSLTRTGFLGFTSNIAITGLSVTADQGLGFNWAAVDNFYVGSAASSSPGPDVPEPFSVMLGVMGLGSVAGFRRLRRA